MHALVRAGADLIELGVPFSDPMADGPVIQLAAERAFQLGLVSLDPALGARDDGATRALWRACETQLAPHTGWSLDRLVTARDRGWFGDGKARGEPLSLCRYLRELARAHLEARGGVTTFGYVVVYHLVQKVDPLGGVWRWAYDDRARVISSTNPLGATWVYTYDLRGNRAQERNPGQQRDVKGGEHRDRARLAQPLAKDQAQAGAQKGQREAAHHLVGLEVDHGQAVQQAEQPAGDHAHRGCGAVQCPRLWSPRKVLADHQRREPAGGHDREADQRQRDPQQDRPACNNA